nr:8377_t:CDS:2 [Entrophospora candida]
MSRNWMEEEAQFHDSNLLYKLLKTAQHLPIDLEVPLSCGLKKNTRNSICSGARMLSFGDSYVGFQHVFDLANNPESVLFHGDVCNVDSQDDSAAYRLFSPEFFLEVSNSITRELVGAFLNRKISH